MGLFGLLKPPSPQASAYRDIAARYQRLRPIRLRLNNELVRRLSRDALDEGAKKLGLLHGGVFVFENEDETSVLMDYCLYDVYRDGRNAVDQYLADCPFDAEADKMTCLRAMQQATFTLIAVLSVEPGVGCQIRNLFTDETRLLADVGFSSTAEPGLVLLTRLLDFGSFVATSGAALPLGILSNDELNEWLRELRLGVNVDCFDPAPLIRSCLQHGASSYIRYKGADEELDTQRRCDDGAGSPSVRTFAPQKRALEKPRRGKSVANRRCRCGSGKMFKNCCGKHAGQLPEEK
jgi:hypothetical protein